MWPSPQPSYLRDCTLGCTRWQKKISKILINATKILLSAGQRNHQRFFPTYCLPICPEHQRSLNPDVLTWAPNHMTRNGLLCNSHMEISQLRTFHTIVRTQVTEPHGNTLQNDTFAWKLTHMEISPMCKLLSGYYRPPQISPQRPIPFFTNEILASKLVQYQMFQ